MDEDKDQIQAGARRVMAEALYRHRWEGSDTEGQFAGERMDDCEGAVDAMVTALYDTGYGFWAVMSCEEGEEW